MQYSQFVHKIFTVEIWETLKKKVFRKSRDLGTLTTSTMQTGTLQVQISEKQTGVLCVIVKNSVCAIDIACLIYSLLGNSWYRATYCVFVVMLV